MKISLIQPGRNNLKYLKWAYDSIRKNQGNHEVEICIADDFSNDGTWDWCQEMIKKDSNFKAIRNNGPTRLGHTILYDTLVNEVATNDICMIYHADMYLCPGALDSIEEHLKEKTIVSLTRIEPPLHPEGPEKVLKDFGIEPEEFNEEELLDWVGSAPFDTADVTGGIFAPWAVYKKDFQEINGHDPLFAPQSKEDSDIFNRFQLNGIKFIQTWKGFVYHMTCRGSRFADGAKRNPDGQVIMKNRETNEWLTQNIKSTREFIRKWGTLPIHDALLKPHIPIKLDIGIVIKNATKTYIKELEPFASKIYCEKYILEKIVKEYIKTEKTSFDLSKKFISSKDIENHSILINIDCTRCSQNDIASIQQLTIELSKEETVFLEEDFGEEFEMGNFDIIVNDLEGTEKELIKCNTL